MFKDETFRDRIEAVRAEILPRLDLAPYVHGSLAQYLDSIGEAMAEARYEAIWAHSGYRQTVLNLIEVGLPGDRSAMSETLRDPVRFTAAIWAMGLHLMPGGLTYARFHGMTQLTAIGSRTLTYALFNYLRFLNYIEPAPGAADRREKRFKPTDLLHKALRGHMAAGMMAIAPVDPMAERIARRMKREDRVYDEVIRRCSDAMLAGAMVERASGAGLLSVMNRRRSGSAMVWALIKAAPVGEAWPSAEPFAVKVAELARWSGVSRPHYMRMLRDAEQAGLLSLDPRRGALTLDPGLRDEMNSLVAFNVICFGVMAQYSQDALVRDQAA